MYQMETETRDPFAIYTQSQKKPEVQPEVWPEDKKWTTNIFALDSTQALC